STATPSPAWSAQNHDNIVRLCGYAVHAHYLTFVWRGPTARPAHRGAALRKSRAPPVPGRRLRLDSRRLDGRLAPLWPRAAERPGDSFRARHHPGPPLLDEDPVRFRGEGGGRANRGHHHGTRPCLEGVRP